MSPSLSSLVEDELAGGSGAGASWHQGPAAAQGQRTGSLRQPDAHRSPVRYGPPPSQAPAVKDAASMSTPSAMLWPAASFEPCAPPPRLAFLSTPGPLGGAVGHEGAGKGAC
jgi:hypothetical protein